MKCLALSGAPSGVCSMIVQNHVGLSTFALVVSSRQEPSGRRRIDLNIRESELVYRRSDQQQEEPRARRQRLRKHGTAQD